MQIKAVIGDQILDSVGPTLYALIIIVINTGLAVIYQRRRSLTVSGAVTASLVGRIIFFMLGVGGWACLLLFFVTSTLLGKFRRHSLVSVATINQKGNCRDWIQVFANGGPASLCAVGFGLTGDPMFLILYGAALAEANSDTWASEIGILSKTKPVLITTFEAVPPGLSGGITVLGTSASLVGAFAIAGPWFLVFRGYLNDAYFGLGIVGVAGFAGALIDSLLGATVQSHFWDTERNQLTEHEVRNGNRYELARGIRGINNDVVNLLSNLAAVGIAYQCVA
jgi:uncharacterized protein (TIGR00297 family)